MPVIDAPCLANSWRIVIVATLENAHLLLRTLEHVEARSLRFVASVLAVDDPSIHRAMAGTEIPVVYSLPDVIDSSSYWTTILSQHLFDDDRTIFLLAGTDVPEHWDARLVAAGQRVQEAAAIAPLCVRHPVFSAFSDATHKPGLTVDETDQWLNDYVDGVEFAVPVMLPSCMLLQGEYWRRSCLEADDRHLFEVLRRHGQWLLATDQVYVDDYLSTYENDVSSLPPAMLEASVTQHPLTGARHALTQLSERAEKPALLQHCLPVQLHVGHSWGGGLGRWIEDYIDADEGHNNLVLRSIGDLGAFGRQIALYRGAAMGIPLRSWTLAEPIQSTVSAHYEYVRLLGELTEEFSVESLMVSSLIGHSIDLLRTGLPTTMVLHDFFPYCPALYATYGSPCQSCGDAQLRDCSGSNPLHSFFKLETDEHWLAIRADFVNTLANPDINLVAPSQSVVDRYRRLESRLQDRAIHVIEHGLEQDLIDRLCAARAAVSGQVNDRLRVVVLGRLTPEKGGKLLAQILQALEGIADFWLLGTGESGGQFERTPNATVVEEYSKAQLGELLSSVNAHMGLLLSVVPETFSYTLSELRAAGIPVLATRLGAFEDRIIDNQDGWLVPIDAGKISERIEHIAADRAALQAVCDVVTRQRVRSAAQMVGQYAGLSAKVQPVPLRRYYLPRRSYRNPYTDACGEQREQALYIDQKVAYRLVLLEFLNFTSRKLQQSPRPPESLKALGNWLLGGCIRLISRDRQ